MVRTFAVAKANSMSEYGLLPDGFSLTGAALLVKPISFTYSTELLAVWPGATSSRMVMRREAPGMIPGRRSAGTRELPEPSNDVIAARGTWTRWEPRSELVT